jgi:hypothetical protein
MFPVLLLGMWRWRDAGLDLHAVFVTFFLVVWAGFLFWKWMAFARRSRAGDVQVEAEVDQFRAGLIAAKTVR